MKPPLPTPAARIQALRGRQSAATPTPPPWRITTCEVTGAIWIERRTGGTKEAVCKMGPNIGKDRDLANAELIIRALRVEQAALDALQSLKRLPNTEGAYRVTCIAQLEKALE